MPVSENSNKIKITHIIYQDSYDKFTLNYIRFMKFYFGEFDQTFVVILRSNNISEENIYGTEVLQCYGKGFGKNLDVLNLLKEADKIIVSGIYSYIPKEIAKLNKALVSKMYLQFWGSDFYTFRQEKIANLHTLKKILIDKRRLVKCVKNCAGIINLIDIDWEEFYKIFPYEVKHFTAPMPGNPEKVIDYDKYRSLKRSPGPFRILVGNSAYETNHHEEVFEWLTRFIDEDIEIVVPLSYGDEKYKNEILKIGMEKMGDRFCPLTEFMNKDSYIEFLNTCDIGIFNLDQQQAMGNINILFSLGKKVYLRKDTPLWKHYRSLGVSPSDILDINTCSFDELGYIENETIEQNIYGVSDLRSNERKERLWRKVFEDEN